jgi:hypothetical protein
MSQSKLVQSCHGLLRGLAHIYPVFARLEKDGNERKMFQNNFGNSIVIFQKKAGS